MDQNNIILILLLIAVLVAFYAIYLAMENSKRIKKINLEMVDLVKLVQESSNLRNSPPFIPPQPELNEPVLNNGVNLEEYPTLEEIHEENSFNEVVDTFTNEYQSSLTTKIIDDILIKGDTSLPNYEEACSSHIPFIKGILETYNKINGSNTLFCPIT